jgi:hypothetical protein
MIVVNQRRYFSTKKAYKARCQLAMSSNGAMPVIMINTSPPRGLKPSRYCRSVRRSQVDKAATAICRHRGFLVVATASSLANPPVCE